MGNDPFIPIAFIILLICVVLSHFLGINDSSEFEGMCGYEKKSLSEEIKNLFKKIKRRFFTINEKFKKYFLNFVTFILILIVFIVLFIFIFNKRDIEPLYCFLSVLIIFIIRWISDKIFNFLLKKIS